MFPTRKELRAFYVPVRACLKNAVIHLVFRLSLLALAIYIANETGRIVTLISTGATFAEVFSTAEHVFVAIGVSILLLAFTVWQRG